MSTSQFRFQNVVWNPPWRVLDGFALEGISQSSESIQTQKISTGSTTAVPETASTLLDSSDMGHEYRVIEQTDS